MLRSPIRAARLLGAAAIFLLGISCASTEKPVVRVEGKIKLNDGTPLPAGTKLTFNPAEGRTGTATAITESDGSFKLTHVTGTSGAETGKYTIQLTPPQGTEKEFYKLVSKDAAEGLLFAEISSGMGSLDLTVPKKK